MAPGMPSSVAPATADVIAQQSQVLPFETHYMLFYLTSLIGQDSLLKRRTSPHGYLVGRLVIKIGWYSNDYVMGD